MTLFLLPQSSAKLYGVTMLTVLTISNDQTTFTEVANNLRKSGAYVSLLFTQMSEAGGLAKAAYLRGVGGPGYTWMTTDAITASFMSSVLPATGVNGPLIWDGAILVAPNTGLGSPAYTKWAQRYTAQPATGTQAKGSLSSGSSPAPVRTNPPASPFPTPPPSLPGMVQ